MPHGTKEGSAIDEESNAVLIAKPRDCLQN